MLAFTSGQTGTTLANKPDIEQKVDPIIISTAKRSKFVVGNTPQTLALTNGRFKHMSKYQGNSDAGTSSRVSRTISKSDTRRERQIKITALALILPSPF
jgi:hypothetical protein